MSALTSAPWWLTLFAVLGAVALVAVIAGLFLPDWHRHPIQASDVGEPETATFLNSLASILNVPVLGGRTEYLRNGERFYPAMLDAIREAQDSVNFQVYIFEPDGIGEEFITAFCERARAGVDVRVLVDAFGSLAIDRRTRKRLRAAGCRIARFRPINPLTLVRVFKRSHRRAIVIDGRIGFTGGAAVADKWTGDARNPDEWRDSMTRVTGPLVHGVQAAFTDNWRYATGELLVGPRFFPEDLDAARDVPAGAPADVPEATGIAVASSPADSTQPVRLVVWIAFSAARERIWLANSYFIPDSDLRDKLCDRAKAGVDVRVLVPGAHTDAKPVRLAGQFYYEELLSAGVRIFEYDPSMMHDKVIVIDGTFAIVGSANMDQRSMDINEENVLGLSSPGFAAGIEEALAADFERSTEMNAEDWRRRSWLRRVAERAALLLVEQY